MSDVLRRADQVVERNMKCYGHPTENFRHIAVRWNLWLEKKLREPLTEEDIAMMFTDVKIARETTEHKDDNIVDICGYQKTYDIVYKHNHPPIGPKMDEPPTHFDTTQYGE